jgi:hypothetical protein
MQIHTGASSFLQGRSSSFFPSYNKNDTNITILKEYYNGVHIDSSATRLLPLSQKIIYFWFDQIHKSLQLKSLTLPKPKSTTYILEWMNYCLLRNLKNYTFSFDATPSMHKILCSNS